MSRRELSHPAREALWDAIHRYARGTGGDLNTLSLADVTDVDQAIDTYVDAVPVPMLLWCPECGDRHIDAGDFATKPHHTHACQSCGMVWRPALGPTKGVQFLPGFRNPALGGDS